MTDTAKFVRDDWKADDWKADDWKADDWESARLRTLTRGLDATPAQRLAWLEEAIRIAHASGALPKPRPEWR